MDVVWYYQRLKSMPFIEILWRLKRLSWQMLAKVTRKRKELFYKKQVSNTPRIIDMIEKVNFYSLDDMNREDVSETCISNTISKADKLLDHLFTYNSLKDFDLGKEINWNREYKRGIDIPLEFGPWMDYRDTKKFGHFKYFWELGRFQHLITLAKAYYLTNDEKYAIEVCDQIKSFVRQCPYLLGVNWIMPMETGQRLLSLAWIVAFLKDHLKNDIETCNLIEEIVTSHVQYTAQNYSFYSSANNHLIGELAGVFAASLCFEEIEGMAKYKQKAYDLLCREISLQYYSDGVNKEQTTHYHVSCYNCFLLSGILGRANGMEFPPDYWSTLEKGAEFICEISNDDNSIFNIGDSDGGKTIVLSDTDNNQVQSLLATAGILFNRDDFLSKAGYLDEMSFWLLGKKRIEDFDSQASQSEKVSSKKFEKGGYYILQSNGASSPKIVFDCGPLGFGDIAAHGHADSLSFMLFAQGKQFFIDPGTYIFEAENPFRNYFRSTAAHNTISIDGVDQSEIKGPFLWLHKAVSHIQEWIDDEECVRVTGWHNGYQRLHDPVIHRRTIELDKQKEIVNINDSIEAKLDHDICQYFHLSPFCQTEKVKENHWRITNSGKTIELFIDGQLNSEVISGSMKPICGWVSESYDSKVETNTIVAKASTKGSCTFSTRIIL